MQMLKLSLTLSLSLNAALLFVACGANYQIPEWKPDLYAGSHTERAIVRRQANQSVKCDDPKFDTYICMSGEDFISIKSDIIDQCKEWKEGTKLVDPNTSSGDNKKIVSRLLKEPSPKAPWISRSGKSRSPS